MFYLKRKQMNTKGKRSTKARRRNRRIDNINTNNNYSYDAEGRLIKDKQEGIDLIQWRVDGKVKSINNSIEGKKSLRFDYDAMGHRIAKHVYTEESTDLLYSTYYILDAQGNVMSTYNRVIDSETPAVLFHQTEKYIYGSSRLGVLNDSIPLYGSQNNWEIVDGSLPMDSLRIISIGELCTSTASWYYEGPGMSGVVNNGFATFTDSNLPKKSYLST